MRKKILVYIITAICLLGITACGSSKTEDASGGADIQVIDSSNQNVEPTEAPIVEATPVPTEEPTAPPEPTATPVPDFVIEWNDANLEKAVRNVIGITEGDIMYSDVIQLKELSISPAYTSEQCITDISALSNFENLEVLNLSMQNITDISALGNLTKITDLYLTGCKFRINGTPVTHQRYKGLASSVCQAFTPAY